MTPPFSGNARGEPFSLHPADREKPTARGFVRDSSRVPPANIAIALRYRRHPVKVTLDRVRPHVHRGRRIP